MNTHVRIKIHPLVETIIITQVIILEILFFFHRGILEKKMCSSKGFFFFFHQGISRPEKWSIQATERATFPASTDSAERFRRYNYKTDARNERS